MIGILWLASYPKSGNTWTRTFLHNLLGILEGTDKAFDINEINEFTTWDIQTEPYKRHMGKAPTRDDKAEIAATRPLVQADIAKNTDGLAIVKTHHALVNDRGYSTINFEVTSGAVYIVRNPLDVAISWAHHMDSTIDHAIDSMEATDFETAVTDKTVHEVYGSWSQHVDSWTRKPHRAIYVMRYEDMLDNPRKTFGNLARHLLLRPTADQLSSAIERSSFDRLKSQEQEHGFREKPEHAASFFREGKSGQWHEGLSRRQVRRIVSTHHVQMRRFGYVTPEIEHLVR